MGGCRDQYGVTGKEEKEARNEGKGEGAGGECKRLLYAARNKYFCQAFHATKMQRRVS